MGFQNYVSETEAAQISGVGVATLRRFVEAGYLKSERDSDGLPLFSTADLIAVFGAPAQQIHQEMKSETITASPSPANDSPPEEQTATAAVSEEASEDSGVTTASPAAPSPAQPHMPALQILEAEVLRLKNVVKLQEQLLDHRDEQIKDLREQREWLHRRLEKSEDKAERDQLLLLAETQTIRKLIILESEKKTPFRQFLEWMGFASPSKPSIVEGTPLPGPTRVIKNPNANANLDGKSKAA